MLRAINPATGEVVREVPCDTPAIVEEKLARAQETARSWKERSFSERGAVLRAVAKLMRERKSELSQLMTEEMGKPVREGMGEVEKGAGCAEFYAEHAETHLATQVIESDATRSYVQHLPLGIVLGILPWNAPVWLAFRVAAPALMAGNVCLIKHDPHVPGCAQALERIFTEAGEPGLFQALLLETPAVEAVIRDRRVAAVSFTGSTQGGKAVAAIAASEIKPAVLELGGSDPSIVLADADLDEAAAIITLSRIINAGQSCIAVKRVLVEASVYEPMLERLTRKMEALSMGDPTRSDTDVGPLARADLRNNLHRQVAETIGQGARCLLGGTEPESAGFFYPPTILADVTPEMTAFCQETFGPVLAVTKVADAAEALALANQTDFGLGASVWTTTERGEAMARQIEAGQVSVNGIVKTDPRLPSGGVKQSGYGRELGPHGIREFVNAQQVWIGPKSA